ncbi:MAG: MBL fold metallo-hydrolase [Chloroflexota bacterium]
MKIADRLYMVGSGAKGFLMTDPFDCNVYVIDGGEAMALIDTGAGLSVDALLQNIQADGLSLERVRYAIVTHGHLDHSGGAAGLRDRLGCGIASSPEVAGFLEAGDEAAISLHLARQAGRYSAEHRLRPCPVELTLGGGEDLELGDLRLHVVSTPGHSTGHIGVLVENQGQRLFFGGDLLVQGGIISLQNTWDVDLRAYLRSIEGLRGLRADSFLPGHSTFMLHQGQRIIDAALERIDRGLIPYTN